MDRIIERELPFFGKKEKRKEEVIPEESEKIIPEELINSLKAEGPVVRVNILGFDQKEVILKKGQSVSLVNDGKEPVKIKSTSFYEFEIDSKGTVTVPLEETLDFFLGNKPEEKLRIIVK